MGHGASVPVASSGELFVNQELVEGMKALCDNETLRTAFVNFIKSGVWVDQLATLVPTCKVMQLNEGRLGDIDLPADKEAVRKYKVTSEKVDEVAKACLRGGSEVFLSKSSTSTSIIGGSPVSSRSLLDCFNDCYMNIDDCKCFNSEQLVSILFNVIFPLFKACSACEGSNHSGDGESLSGVSGITSSDGRGLLAKTTRRLQDILLGCAAYFDESVLLSKLQNSNWLASIVQAVDSYSMSITISDVSTKAHAIVYSNKAFKFAFGYSGEQLNGRSLAILNGPCTESAQVAIMHAAMCEGKAVKVGVTHYTRSKAAVLNLVAIRAVGRYSVAVHFPITKGSRLEDLGMVDDLLVLIASLLKNAKMAPPCTEGNATPQSGRLWSKNGSPLISRKRPLDTARGPLASSSGRVVAF